VGTIPTTAIVASRPLVFSGGLDRVPTLWNEAAAGLGLDFFLGDTALDGHLPVVLPNDLVLSATTDPITGLVRTLMIAAGPGQGQHGQVTLAMWGNLIAMVNLELGPDGRRALPERLGAHLEAPLSVARNQETVEGGARCRLRSSLLDDRVWLNVARQSRRATWPDRRSWTT
jgi:hypothetical protein